MKKVILQIRNAAPQDFGGAETYPVSLSLLLKGQGYDPIIVTRSNKLLKYAENRSVRTVRGWWWKRQNWDGWHTLFFPIYVIWQLVLTLWYVRLILVTKAIALHVQSRDDFIAATVAGRLTGRKVIWTDHMDLRYIFKNIAKPLRNPVGKFVFCVAHLAHHIILISDNEYRLVTSCFKDKESLKQQITIIKNGVVDRLPELKKAPRKNENVVFCLASRMVTNKGVGEAVSAFARLKTYPDAHGAMLEIYGDGPEMTKFQELAKDVSGITFHGHQTDAIPGIYNADVFILPSYQEGLSIALLEACMLGKAIIATNVDSNPELIKPKETGLLVKPKDVEDLENAMQVLLRDRPLRAMVSKNARKLYEQSYDLEKIAVDKIAPLYG